MRKMFHVLLASVLLGVLLAGPAQAQYRKYPVTKPAIGEAYHVEVSGDLWKPDPALTISSEGLGLIGDEIDAVNDLGFLKTRFKELRVVLRPAKKHKFRFDYIPITFDAESTLKRDVIFNGLKYSANLPINSQLKWNAYHFGYEYDFLYRSRWFIGMLLEAKYTDVNVSLESPVNHEYTSVKAPIPAVGGIVRVYPVDYISVTGEVSGFKLPTSVDKENRYDGRYVDFNIYGTINVTKNFGAQIGYRSLDVMYRVENDNGNFTLKGLYFGGALRY